MSDFQTVTSQSFAEDREDLDLFVTITGQSFAEDRTELSIYKDEVEETLTSISEEITNLHNTDASLLNDIEATNELLNSVSETANYGVTRIIKKEDTDFIIKTNDNIALEIEDNVSLDLVTGETVIDVSAQATKYIIGQGKYCSNNNNIDVCFYDAAGSNGEYMYTFISGISVQNGMFFIPNGANSFRASIQNKNIFIIENTDEYREDYIHYDFDKTLETAIKIIINNQMDEMINKSY